MNISIFLSPIQDQSDLHIFLFLSWDLTNLTIPINSLSLVWKKSLSTVKTELYWTIIDLLWLFLFFLYSVTSLTKMKEKSFADTDKGQTRNMGTALPHTLLFISWLCPPCSCVNLPYSSGTRYPKKARHRNYYSTYSHILHSPQPTATVIAVSDGKVLGL